MFVAHLAGLHRLPQAALLDVAAAVLLEAVGEDIREYLRGRRDTIRCIVTMLTDDSAGSDAEGDAAGESLFEELKRTVADEVSQTCITQHNAVAQAPAHANLAAFLLLPPLSSLHVVLPCSFWLLKVCHWPLVCLL